MLVNRVPTCLTDESLAIYRVKIFHSLATSFISQHGLPTTITQLKTIKETRKKAIISPKEGNAGFVVFMANKVDVTTLVQIFQLSNRDLDIIKLSRTKNYEFHISIWLL